MNPREACGEDAPYGNREEPEHDRGRSVVDGEDHVAPEAGSGVGFGGDGGQPQEEAGAEATPQQDVVGKER